MSIQVVELTNERRRLIEELLKCANETTKPNVQITEQQATCMALTCENNELNQTIDKISKKDLKGKGKGSRIQFQLEEDLTNAKVDLSILMNKNTILEDELT